MQVNIINDIVHASQEMAKDLAGYAAQAAIKELASNWRDAHNDQCLGFGPDTMASDLDQVITLLTKLKLRTEDRKYPNDSMRAALGLL